MSERARLAAEVERLKASTAAEVVSNKAELGAQREKLEQQAAELVARAEALAAGEMTTLWACMHADGGSGVDVIIVAGPGFASCMMQL